MSIRSVYLVGLTSSSGSFSFNSDHAINSIKLKEFVFPQQTFPNILLQITFTGLTVNISNQKIVSPNVNYQFYIPSSLNTTESYVVFPSDQQIISFSPPVYLTAGTTVNYTVLNTAGTNIPLIGGQTMSMILDLVITTPASQF